MVMLELNMMDGSRRPEIYPNVGRARCTHVYRVYILSYSLIRLN